MSDIFEPYRANRYRPDVQGVRAIGAILIAVYHIWINKVSGGVDVFFVVSGFLMTGVLLRQQASEGRIKPFQFWGGIVKRVAPSAYLVLLATFVLGYFFLPPPFWRVALSELLYSALHVENLELMRRSVDYLAKENPATVFQQFWALSVMVQLYFLLPLLLIPGVVLSRACKSVAPLVLVVTLSLLASFVYSVYATSNSPVTTYFNTAARAWEFLAGALLALLAPKFDWNGKPAAWSAFAGLVILLGTGLVVPSSLHFPGFVALLPVLAALLLLASGIQSQDQSATGKLLSNSYLVALGGISFTVYLWHWPILVYAQHYYSTTSLSLLQGSAVIVMAIGLAFLTTRIVERPFRRIPRSKPWPAFLLGFLFFLPTVLPAVGASQYLSSLYSYLEEDTSSSERDYFRGRRIAIQEDAEEVGLPQFSSLDSNKAVTIEECLYGKVCESGDTSSERVVALVGGSHAAHWEPALSIIGRERGFKLVSMLRVSCALGYLEWMDDECLEYNNRIVSALEELQPDFVITNSTRLDRYNESEQVEFVPDAYLDQWRKITALGIPILGIRDNPWFENSPSLCVLRKAGSASQCARPMDELYVEKNPADQYEESLTLFHSLDFMDLICVDGLCPAVFDNHLIYFDTNHFTRTYMEYMSGAVMASLETQAPAFFKLMTQQDELESPSASQ